MTMHDRELDDAEDWYRSLGRYAQTALPGVIQGAKTGAAAGPYGAVIGGVAGGVSRLSGPRGGAVVTPRTSTPPPAAPGIQGRPAAGVAPPVGGVAPGPPAATVPAPGAVPAGPGPANPAAAALLAVLEDQRLRAALAAGTQGQSEIPVAGTVAPPAAFLNLVSWLAQEAAQQMPTMGQTPVDGYLRGPDGAYVTDVASPAARARVLLERLQAERAGAGALTESVTSSAEQWLIESGLAELV